MAEPVAVGMGLVGEVLGDKVKEALGRTYGKVVELCVLLMFFANYPEPNRVILATEDAARRTLTFLGVHDSDWLEALIAWLNRPESQQLAVGAVVVAALAPIRWRVFGPEIAWVLLLAASVSLDGWVFFWAGVINLGAHATLAGVAALGTGTDGYGRQWYLPSSILEDSVRSVLEVLLLPVLPLIRLVSGIVDRFKFDRDPGPPASGAAVHTT
ncbi:hypothetical protein [Sinomonas sp. ASV322]|uniref:hypothetical protein n=1 Tax=Sinomonas sp. ASV322 TaxID=3041920 RepID=UPI0027DD948C|nr:hypothetical protein [Sinomonas sp. ASV322]MDQ4503735.1 hypothetical protein [Sinomonas sp. ASV322]